MVKEGKDNFRVRLAIQFNFKANDDDLNFDNTDNLSNANDNYSSGFFR